MAKLLSNAYYFNSSALPKQLARHFLGVSICCGGACAANVRALNSLSDNYLGGSTTIDYYYRGDGSLVFS